MADIKIALEIVLEFEGGHVKDPDDTGGETYRGISRRYHPEWEGWSFIDIGDFGSADILVEEFYRHNYWNKICADKIRSQEVANELMEMSIHLGHYRVHLVLQEGLNIFNNRQKLWKDIKVDGVIGKKTIYALSKADKRGRSHVIANYLNCEQGHMYKESIQKREINEKYAVGWFKRT